MEKMKSAVNNESVQNGSTAKTKKTFAEVTKTNQQKPNLANIKNLLRSGKIEDQLEEQRKQSKQSNIIIHGVPESDDTDHDTDFLDQLLDDTGIDNEQELNVSRIGQTSNSNRPIKVVFTDIHEKRVFMQSLTKLKEDEKYAKISITEDFTRTERELIKNWKNNADQRKIREKNQKYVWRVQDSPCDSRGLYLKKIFTKTCI